MITMNCAAGESATENSSLEEADKYAFMSYKFENDESMIEPRKKSSI